MALDGLRLWDATPFRLSFGLRFRLLRLLKRFFGNFPVNSIARRIVILNFVGVLILVGGIFYLNEGRVKFTQTRVENLTVQAAIIASAIAQTSTSEGAAYPSQFGRSGEDREINPELSTLSFRINPETVAPMLRDLVGPTKTHARIYDADGDLLLDSQKLYLRGQVGRAEELPLPAPDLGALGRLWLYLKMEFFSSGLPLYIDPGQDGKSHDGVRLAINNGSQTPLISLTQTGETVISVAMPIKRSSGVAGALFLTTQGSDIDAIVAAERLQVVEVAGLVIAVTAVLSWLLAGTIAGPMRRLAVAAERVRKNIKTREQIPDFSHRSDEIGYLSRTLCDMTNALYLRLDAIESFAADVSHELKNPLTSLRSAAGMLAFVKHSDDRQKLVDIIQHDVRRLDRLITDIADASRLDAELARGMARPVNMASLLSMLCEISKDSRTRNKNKIDIQLRVQGCATPQDYDAATGYTVCGHDSRLSQVIVNLVDNAISFSPAGGTVYVSARRVRKSEEIEIAVEDEGPGIPDGNMERIFERFYTDRPEPEAFGQNSGLGLNISQQIVKAHNGRIWAENRACQEPLLSKRAQSKAKVTKPVPTATVPGKIADDGIPNAPSRESYGARFLVRLPAAARPAS